MSLGEKTFLYSGNEKAKFIDFIFWFWSEKNDLNFNTAPLSVQTDVQLHSHPKLTVQNEAERLRPVPSGLWSASSLPNSPGRRNNGTENS